MRHCGHKHSSNSSFFFASHWRSLAWCLTAELLPPPPVTSQCRWLSVCMITAACPFSASPFTWRSPARHLRPPLWPEGWPVPCPRSRSRWSQTTTQTSSPTGRGTWAVRPRYKAEKLVCCWQNNAHYVVLSSEYSQCWPIDGTRGHRLTTVCIRTPDWLCGTDAVNARGVVNASTLKRMHLLMDVALYIEG